MTWPPFSLTSLVVSFEVIIIVPFPALQTSPALLLHADRHLDTHWTALTIVGRGRLRRLITHRRKTPDVGTESRWSATRLTAGTSRRLFWYNVGVEAHGAAGTWLLHFIKASGAVELLALDVSAACRGH